MPSHGSLPGNVGDGVERASRAAARRRRAGFNRRQVQIAPTAPRMVASSEGADPELVDWIVVGGGAAGCVLAARLSDDHRSSVLLLEAGPRDRHPYIAIPAAFPKLFDSPLDWGDRTVPQAALGGRRVFWPRGRVLGGSTSINAMMWVRGLAADYDGWASVAGPGWDFASLRPAFERVERADPTLADPPGELLGYGRRGAMRISSPRAVHPLTQAWLAAGGTLGLGPLVPNGGGDDGVAAAMLSQHRGRRFSAADAYLRPARRRPNLAVRTGTLVDRVLLDGGRASGVVYARGRSLRRASCRAGVVLAAGAVGTPAILLRSGIGPPGDLARVGVPVLVEHPGVGRNLQDHLTAGVVASAPNGVIEADTRAGREILAFALHGRGRLASNLCEGYGYLRSRGDLALPDLELIFLPAAFLDEGLTMPAVRGVTLGAVLLQPKSRGVVRLLSRDPASPPEIDPCYLSDPAGEDAATLAAGVGACLRLLGSPPLSALVGDLVAPVTTPGEDVVAAAIREHAQTLYHPAGTCAMGLDATAVLDSRLAVRRVERLHVADASAIPLLPRGHTTASTLALAERASELLTGSA